MAVDSDIKSEEVTDGVGEEKMAIFGEFSVIRWWIFTFFPLLKGAGDCDSDVAA